MKIAILLCGHIRTWKSKNCDKSFKDTFKNIDIDVFLHTYCDKYDNNEIIEMFNDINIIDYSIENLNDLINELKDSNISNEHINMFLQQRKINLCKNMIINHISKTNCKYDLVIKTRPDIIYNKSLDFYSMYKDCINNICFTSFLTNNCDVVAISNQHLILYNYCNLFETFNTALKFFNDSCVEMSVHIWLYYYVFCKYNLKSVSNIDISIIRNN